ncbi:hypothetical protein WK66_29370 [Burkholderia ubonensis]|nr:hypothetical protein WK66_29370 [Burkholderia ubonensis]
MDWCQALGRTFGLRGAAIIGKRLARQQTDGRMDAGIASATAMAVHLEARVGVFRDADVDGVVTA